jgi:hypothetical protein
MKFTRAVASAQIRPFHLFGCLLLLLGFVGCASIPENAPSSRQQAEADLVINFQSWNSISFVKPDVTGNANALMYRQKTFRKSGFVKLLNNLKLDRKFVVVVLDRAYSPDPATAYGGMDEIQKFFVDLGFQRVAFQDSASGFRIIKDSGSR